MKYNIDKSLFPYNHFKPPLSKGFLKLASKFMIAPKAFIKNKDFNIKLEKIKARDNEYIEAYVITPNELIDDITPMLFYIHGGGFVLKAAKYHYLNALRYAKECKCRVVFPLYRLTPKYVFPTFLLDCFDILSCFINNHKEYKIDVNNIGVGGDSAGANISCGLTLMMHKENKEFKFKYLMLIYPFLDPTSKSISYQKYDNTPLWNSKLSKKVTPIINAKEDSEYYRYYSIFDNDDFSFFPPTYIEVAEYDCLHDDGMVFKDKLNKDNIKVIYYEINGVMHGYDIKINAPIVKKSMQNRINFINSINN